MIARILEAEVMDSAEEALEYDAMDHGEVNACFATDFLQALEQAGLPVESRVLDVGTGTALIPLEIGRRSSRLAITAIDLAEEMLKLGRRNVERAGLAGRITLLKADAKDLAQATGTFDAVLSNSIVHHIPEPLSVFTAMRGACRAGGLLFVRDLLRPETMDELGALVRTYAGEASDRQRQLFADSLQAALTVKEVSGLLQAVGLPADAVQRTSDRHWTVCCVVPA
ncbi:Demethylrebeccamycin-D-glucose O-methyltransferase [Caulifigura coniformis]|uniref:Demethylrebeccamycin-D-glucose O-methyltransferase n=1 Tax=Caulifigura coniformis TaxID=2527983 RepID=A0A517SA18_9PLAN|nr:class I SAM-dependent methyltransferase [Caulifigura coniformis]QDT52962.1 Demethylrebeccamycin-D-glucose O-methyltransferase [Caulifigura coniformis]